MSDNIHEKQFLDVYDKYADDIFRYVFYKAYNYEIAKDLTQEVFTKAWKYLVDDNEVKNLRALLYKMAKNVVIDYHRKKTNQEYSIEALDEQGVYLGDEHKGEKDIKLKTDFKLALKLIDKLEESYREVFYLRYVEDLKPKEIAELIDESPNVVSVRINRATDKMRQFLKDI